MTKENGLLADKDGNGKPDIIELFWDYLIVVICLYLAVMGFNTGKLDGNNIKWLLAFASLLSGGRTLAIEFIKNKLK